MGFALRKWLALRWFLASFEFDDARWISGLKKAF
jgi:hypothetical protein